MEELKKVDYNILDTGHFSLEEKGGEDERFYGEIDDSK